MEKSLGKVDIQGPNRFDFPSLCIDTAEEAMGEVVNLNRFRKARAKAEQEKQAEENRAAFGRTKAEKRQSNSERDRADQDLDGKKLT